MAGTTISNLGGGNLSIDGSGVMTLAKVQTDTGAILIGGPNAADAYIAREW